MGMRLRLKSTYDCSQLARAARVVCLALQRYGALFADNGSPFFVTGEATPAWDTYLQEIKVSASSSVNRRAIHCVQSVWWLLETLGWHAMLF